MAFQAACSEQGETGRPSWDHGDHLGIIGGQTVSAADPVARRVHLMEKLTLRNGKKFRGYCSTGLVHRRLALIAAHCLPQEEERASLQIRFTLPDKKTTDIKVIDWEAHPEADLALLELASDAPSSVEILYLPNADQTFNPRTIEVAGYGDVTGEVGQDGKSGILRQVSLDVVSYDRDSREIRVDQSRGKGFCIGDSGAPGMIMKENGYPALIGIATEARGASKNNRCDQSGYFVNLSLYLDWIYQTGRDIQGRTSRPANQL